MSSATTTLAGKQALVTGASQGIGNAIVRALIGAQANVCLVGRQVTKLDALARELGPQASVGALDLDDTDSISQLAAANRDGLDILVNCGGQYVSGTMNSAQPGTFAKLMQTNVTGPYELTRQLLPGITARRGQIVFINSSVVNNIGPHNGPFAATAMALRAIAESLRAEVNPKGVRVLSVYPGRTATPRQAAIFAREGRDYKADKLLQPTDIAAAIVHSLLMPPTAEVTDIWLRPARNF